MLYAIMNLDTHRVEGYAHVPDDRIVWTYVEDGRPFTKLDDRLMVDGYMLPVLPCGSRLSLDIPEPKQSTATQEPCPHEYWVTKNGRRKCEDCGAFVGWAPGREPR